MKNLPSRVRSGPSVRVLGLGVIERHLVVLGIELHQDRARVGVLVVLNLHRDDVAAHTGADGNNVRFNLSVIGGFTYGIVTPYEYSSHQDEGGHQSH